MVTVYKAEHVFFLFIFWTLKLPANRPAMNLPKKRPSVTPTQPGSRSAPQVSTAHNTTTVSLHMTVTKDSKGELRQFSAGSNMSLKSRQAEEEKVEQLKHMNLVIP